ncbi:hypothetical protein FALBO_7013 [Fusarium albosuccineum]|uniref:Short-chain dehydrogenase/reductase n=1 Tax=Fusarium albosuccineum TaxID=1237068 RepID=A0A8H4PB85_9HYPO|nr:hypothetical protein FALBO_7013 [Fusarium albosuccineum]
MASLAKTVVATGVSSGLGLEAIKQLLEQTQPHKIILGARNIQNTQKAYDEMQYDRAANGVSILPLDLADLKGVKSFAEKTLEKLGQSKIDYLLLNAGISNSAEGPSPHGSRWCESYVVNHLFHLLREKLVESKSRIVFVSSGAVRNVPDPSTLDTNLKAASGTSGTTIYCETKLTALLGAHWWRRQLTGTNDVVAVSPGLIPATGIGRGSGMKITTDMPDAKSVPEGKSSSIPAREFRLIFGIGARSILGAFERSDFPEDPDRIFLTSWGEWWEKSVIEASVDKALQDKWCPSKEEIERDEGISA